MLQTEMNAEIIASELDQHYASLEKLHSVVMSEYFALSQNELDFIPELSKTKSVLLREIEEKRRMLREWRLQLADTHADDDDGMLSHLRQPVRRLKALLHEIIHLEKNNARLVQYMKKKFDDKSLIGAQDAN